MPRLRFLAGAILVVCLELSNCAAGTSQQPKPQMTLPANYGATAVTQSGATRSFVLTIYVGQLTSEGEIQELSSTLKHKGQDGLVSALDDVNDRGRVGTTTSVGTGMRIVRVRPAKHGGWHIVMVANRNITYAETFRSTGLQAYKFGIVVLDVDSNGKGTGLLSPACMLKFNKKNELEVEHYGQQPFRLVNVVRQGDR